MFKRDRILRRALRDRVIATLRSGDSFDGLLFDVDAATFHFVDAVALTGTARAKVDGSLFLPRNEVVYMQKVGGAA